MGGNPTRIDLRCLTNGDSRAKLLFATIFFVAKLTAQAIALCYYKREIGSCTMLVAAQS